MKIYTGTSGFAVKEWKGKFYPEKIPPKEMLHFYAEHFHTVEINNTFYHMPMANVLSPGRNRYRVILCLHSKLPRS
jgi:uncharacterized protein YecE (DUF72 family)